MHINPYLHFNGNCREAYEFYETVFGTKIGMIMTNGDAPMACEEDWRDKIMHASMSIGGIPLMGADSPPAHYQKPAGFSVSIGLTDTAEAERIFAALAAGGTTTMALQETFWAARFGMCTDRFGIPWMVNCENS
jgi:PhnB protein